jgi:hypothetical protein
LIICALVTFANTAALAGLLAVPALVAVHFFQQRARRVELSTLFLIEKLAPESRGGRTWERWRGSREFWLQVLAVLLAVWVLAEPRWVRADSSQVVVVVLDDAMALRAVEAEARAAAANVMAESAARAARTEWVVLTSDARRPALYRGPDRARAEAALASWRPALGTHEYAPALRLARGLAGAGGAVWFITDRESKVPPDQAAVGVGRALANVGFAGGDVTPARSGEGAGRTWRAVVKNHADTAQRRAWWIETPAGASERRVVEIAPGAVLELSGAWPATAERAVLRLERDGFEADDLLPLVRPEPKRLSARVAVGGEAGEFFRRALGAVDGVAVGASLAATLRVVEERPGEATVGGPAIVLAAAKTAGAAERRLARAPVVAERHALVDGLNWQGLLGTGPAGLRMAAADEALLWQGAEPLVWLRAGAEGRRALVWNLDWSAGNAGRLPASVLLVKRHAEAVRDAQAGVYAANFDAGGPVPIAEADRLAAVGGAEWSVEREGAPRRVVEAAELAVLRAPAEAGFFVVRRGEEVLVRGAASFADARQGDFRGAGSFRREPPAGEAEAARARNTQGDPLALLWLTLAAAALLGSWWPGRTGELGVGPRNDTKGHEKKTEERGV